MLLSLDPLLSSDDMARPTQSSFFDFLCYYSHTSFSSCIFISSPLCQRYPHRPSVFRFPVYIVFTAVMLSLYITFTRRISISEMPFSPWSSIPHFSVLYRKPSMPYVFHLLFFPVLSSDVPPTFNSSIVSALRHVSLSLQLSGIFISSMMLFINSKVQVHAVMHGYPWSHCFSHGLTAFPNFIFPSALITCPFDIWLMGPSLIATSSKSFSEFNKLLNFSFNFS